MIIEYTVTHVEMTARPPAPTPGELELSPHRTGVGDEEVRETLERIGAPLGWSSAALTEQGWLDWLGNSHHQRWLFRETSTGRAVGLLELDPQAGGDVEIVVFGLVPEFIADGRKYGREALLLGVERAWRTDSLDGPARRLWLHTSSRDHEHALGNYLARGFRVFKTEQKAKAAK